MTVNYSLCLKYTTEMFELWLRNNIKKLLDIKELGIDFENKVKRYCVMIYPNVIECESKEW
jgi:hypothetical protein